MATWLWALLNRGTAGRAYNVGASEPVTIAELARQVARRGDPPVSVDIQGVPREGTSRDHYLPDVSLIKEELGVRESVSLSDAIARTMHWHRSRP